MLKTKEILVPDIGNFKDVAVIEVQVKPGDRVQAETPLLTLESDKAVMEVPSPESGEVREVRVNVGDKISQGHLILLLDVEQNAQPQPAPTAVKAQPEPAPSVSPPRPSAPPLPSVELSAARTGKPHAAPAVRRLASSLGADLAKVSGTGRKGRILREDIVAFIKGEMSKPKGNAASGAGLALPEMPDVDFSQFGDIEIKPLSRIQKISSAALHRNWLLIPHVTQFDEADITELEAFRVSLKDEAAKRNVKMTPLIFLVKAAVAALRAFPRFNASLAADKVNLVIKKYFHIGFAVDTADGLVVPVIRDADRKSLFELAVEISETSQKAREGKLSPADMQGGCFTISSLGGIGGTAFTPIINAPEVAILGVSRAKTQQVWDEQQAAFVPQLMLTLSLSYDHRVIDGAQAVRFTSYLSYLLADTRRLLL